LTNSAPADGLPEDVIGNRHEQPPGTNHLFLTVYSALRALGATVDGRPAATGAASRFGLSAFTVVVDVAPGQTVTMTMQLTGTVARGDAYRLAVVRQPVVNPDRIDISVVGRSGFIVTDSDRITIDQKQGKATVG